MNERAGTSIRLEAGLVQAADAAAADAQVTRSGLVRALVAHGLRGLAAGGEVVAGTRSLRLHDDRVRAYVVAAVDLVRDPLGSDE